MSDPRQALTTEDVVHLVQIIGQAMGKARRSHVRDRLTLLREKLQRIGQFDANAINHAPAMASPLHPDT